MTNKERLDRANLEFVFFGPMKIPRKFVAQAAAAIMDARAQVGTGPKRSYSVALQDALRADEITCRLYLDGPRPDLEYFLNGSLEAAGLLLDELRGK